MKNIEIYEFELLSTKELVNTNGGEAIEGSYSLGYAVGWVISHLSFGCYYAL